VPYPFSDLSGSKLRPAIVLAPLDRGDIVLCQVTSNPKVDRRAVALTDSDFSTGSLVRVSYARPGKLFTGHLSVIADYWGMLTPDALRRVIDAVIAVLRGET
jgi:mRNA interferase MazF